MAQLAGTAGRHADGRGDCDPVAELHGITTDPRLLGIAAGPFYLDQQDDARAATVLPLLRAAGADEQTIVQQADQVREWRIVPTWH